MSDEIPLVVVGSAAEATLVVRRLARSGWTPHEGFAVPDQRWDLRRARLVCHGRVADTDTAALALMAAARGASVVAVADPGSGVGRALVADLGRLGMVRTVAEDDGEDGAVPEMGPRLAPEQRALLDRLASGETIAAAAAAEFLSLRTANRRIAAARKALGVRTTREAVLVYLRTRRQRGGESG